MDVIEALDRRFTVRAFRPDPVGRDTLEKVMEAALKAPSWANTQPWEVYVAGGNVLDRLRESYMANMKNGVERNPDLAMPREWPQELMKRIEALKSERAESVERASPDKSGVLGLMEVNYRFFDAPVVAFICMDRKLTAWSVYDLGLFSQSLMLAACHHGLGSAVAVTLAAHPDLIRKELGIPDGLMVVIGIALGYEDKGHPQNSYKSPRKPIGEAVRFRGI